MLDAVQITGWAGAIVAVAGLLTRPVVRRRLLLVCGALLLLAVAILEQRWMFGLVALVVAGLNLRGLLREKAAGAAASDTAALPLERHDPFLDAFLRANLDDIHRSQPDFTLEADADVVWLLTRSGMPTGVFLGRREGAELDVVLDYVTPRYRDTRSGRWLVQQGARLSRETGCVRLVATASTYEHQSYLESLGFRPEGARWIKDLDA